MKMTNRAKAALGKVFLALALSVAAALTLPSQARASVNHTQAEAVAWANARAAEGWCVDYDGAAGVQCVDLILAYYDYLVGWHTSGNAIDYASNELPSGWTRVGNPQAGDVVVWNPGVQIGSSSIGGGNEWANSTYGHIGIVTEVRDGYIVCVETNTYYGGKPATPFNRLISGVACYIRPDFDQPPVGIFASCEGGDNNTLRVQGWAYDPDVPNDAIAIHVYVGGPAGSGAPCYSKDAAGNDLLANYQFRSQGKSEFDYTLRVNEAGLQQIYVYAINNTPNSHNPELSGSGMETVIRVGDKGNAVTTLPDGRYAIRTKLKPTSGFEVQGASLEKNTPIVLGTWTGAANQQFDLAVQSDSSYTMTATHSGFAIEMRRAAQEDGAVPTQLSPNGTMAQRWWLEANDDGTWSFRSRVSGKYLDLKRELTDDGAAIQQYTGHGNDNQRWYIVPVDASKWDVSVADESHDPEPDVTVAAGGIELVEGTDYDVSYSDNEVTGTATVTITAKNGYTGTTTATFEYVCYDKDGWVDLSSGAKGYVKNGKLVTGWLTLGDAKYWFHEDGTMARGWTDVVVNGKTMHYYFNPASGNLARGTWMEIDAKKYYFRPSGNAAHGWATISDGGVDKKYYFDDDFQLVTGWRDIVNDNGVTNHYYFRPSGSMATGWATIDGQKYWFRASGNMATGFASVDDAYKRYFDENGHMLTGWQEIGGKTYYFRASGAMQTGTATIDGMVFRFTDNGVLIEDANAYEVNEGLAVSEEIVADEVEAGGSDEVLDNDQQDDGIDGNSSAVSGEEDPNQASPVMDADDHQDAEENLNAEGNQDVADGVSDAEGSNDA